MTAHPMLVPADDHKASKSEMRDVRRWQHAIEARIAELEACFAELKRAQPARMRGVSAPGIAALEVMGQHSKLMLNATDWSRNSGGTFSDSVLRSLAALGLVDRLDRQGVQDPGGHLYRINRAGLDWLQSHESAS